jgi:hypothetical protein
VPATYEDALAVAREIERRFPGDLAFARMAEAIVRLRRREWAAAESALTAVVDDPRATREFQAAAALRLAKIHASRGETQAALARARQARDLDRSSEDAARLILALGGKLD